MYVFDTSAFLNGWRYHYPPATFPSVWRLIEEGLNDGRVIAPREVFTELTVKDDDVHEWAKPFVGCFVDPTEAVQGQVGTIQALLPKPGVRDVADPWVIAEAKVRALTVVTYEGQSFSGTKTIKASTKMPGLCQHFSVPCLTLPQALGNLGGTF